MGRMKARKIAALGLAIAIAMQPRAALAADYLELDTGNMMICPIPDYNNAGDYTLDLNLAQNVYPFKPSESSVTASSGTSSTSVTLSGTSTYNISYTNEQRKIEQNGYSESLLTPKTSATYYPFSYKVTTSGGSTYVDPTTSSRQLSLPSVMGTYTGLQFWLPSEVGTLTGSGTESLNGTTTGTYEEDGTVYLDRNVGQGYYSCAAPTDGWTGNYCYCFVGYGDVARGGGAYRQYIANIGESVRFYVPRFTYWIDDVFVNGVTKNGFAANYYGFAYMDETDTTHVVTNVTNTYELPANARYVGVILRFDKREIQKGSFLVFKPFQMWIKASPIEQTIERETEQQTAELKDTTGSGTILSNLTGGGTEQFDENIGLFGQLTTVTDMFGEAITGATASGVIQFPGVTVMGVELVAAQSVDIWQGGLAQFETPVKAFMTFGLVAAWFNGMKHLFEVQVLGYANDDDFSRSAREAVGMDPDIPF